MDKNGLKAKLRQEVLVTPWLNLEREFAAGRLVAVDQRLDLVEVGSRMALDDKATFAGWLQAGLVFKPSPDQACTWHAKASQFDMLIVSPFVLIQELSE
ncbi:MAG: hypothetical protein BWY87_01312 [Deltaproteobacteria bacterium ADurb.Bin510]|nr:MAG: hypothetical protein BWY87_01312 [Deltaproteobacteria bacterium ADurb.Bin510]